MPILHDGDGPVGRPRVKRDGPCEWCGAPLLAADNRIVWERVEDEDIEPGDAPVSDRSQVVVVMCRECIGVSCAIGRGEMVDVWRWRGRRKGS